jgi:hypothetical protein
MWDLHEPAPASKKPRARWNEDLHEPAPASKETAHALE